MHDSTRDPSAVPVTFITDVEQARAELGALRDAAMVAADTETVIRRDDDGNIIKVDLDVDGPGPWRVTSFAARFQTPEGVRYQAWVLDMAHVDAPPLSEAIADVTLWGWNANFDRGVFTRGGVPSSQWSDAMLWDAVLKQGAYYGVGERPWYTSLSAATTRWLGWDPMDGKDDTRLSYDETTPLTDEQIRYAALDAIATLFVAEDLVQAAEDQGLKDVCERTCRAQPFVHAMKVTGLPFDADGYQTEIDNAQAKVDAASEQIAVLTTGQDLLLPLVQWAQSTGITPGLDVTPEGQELADLGLPLLHDEDTFKRFLDELRRQSSEAAARIGTLLGIDAVDDLFADGKRYELPFGIDDPAAIRRWINKSAPQFVAQFVAQSGSTSRGLVKAHNMHDVYEQMAQEPADVSPTLAKVASELAAYTRNQDIVSRYQDVVGPVKLRPSWNINSGEQVKDHLNRFAQDRVLEYTEKAVGNPRLLAQADSVDNKVLKLIGGPLCAALLEFRKHEKTVTTYGEELVKAVHPRTGRVHASYTQELTGTARLASSAPNAQNLSPLAKPYIGEVSRADGQLTTRNPSGKLRVLVYADLSQAELRFLAHMAQDERMLEAFRSGEDLHERTASLMFKVDLKALKANGDKTVRSVESFLPGVGQYASADPDLLCSDLYAQLRHKAKAVSFGYAYGLKGASLAMQLTTQGVPTTKQEADLLLKQFDEAYPQVAAWMQARVSFVQELSNRLKDQSQPSGVDFEASWTLHKTYFRANSARKVLAGKLQRQPTPREIAEHLVPDDELRARLGTADTPNGELTVDPDLWETTRSRQAEQVAWALGHYGSAILAEDGTPWSFESRNLTNRRRLFQIGTRDWTLSMVSLVARSRRKYAQGLTAAWVKAYNDEQDAIAQAAIDAGNRPAKVKHVSLTKTDPRTKRTVPLLPKELEKAMPSQEIRISFVNFVLEAYRSLQNPNAARDYLFRHAMADCVRALSNQYRNHPIQSGVADAVLEAFARIHVDLVDQFPHASPIQSVHDSIAIECDLADALDVKDMLVRHMEGSLSEMCTTVPCIADGAVLLNLDEKHSELSEDEVRTYVAQYDLAA